jgi:polar amino acid transport system substrate-binding protein
MQLVLALVLSNLSWGGWCEPHVPLRVGVDSSPPFSMETSPGDWQGISVDLWEASAEKLGWKYTYVTGDFQDLLAGLESCSLDVVIPAVTVTAAREGRFDFTIPYMVEDVAVAADIGKDPIAVAGDVIWTLRWPAVLLLCSLSIAGVIYYTIEKQEKVTGPFGRDGSQDFHDFFSSIYWAMTTMVTVGYGDEAPKRFGGRAFAMCWMFGSLFLVSSLNAQIIGAFSSVSRLPEVDDITDLRGKRVVTVAGTYSSDLLSVGGVKHTRAKTEKEMLDLLRSNEYDFAVFDRTMLSYGLRDGAATVLPVSLTEQQLAFAVRDDFPGLEQLNQTILHQLDMPWWRVSTFKYTHEE